VLLSPARKQCSPDSSLLVLTLVAQGAGFSAKDRAVLLGAVASVERAAASAKAGRAVSERPCRSTAMALHAKKESVGGAARAPFFFLVPKYLFCVCV
jgi:hypothetical protein